MPGAAPWGRWLRLTWWSVCLAVLVWRVLVVGLSSAEDDRYYYLLVLGLISFPAGPLWLWALPALPASLAAYGLDPTLLPPYWKDLAAWLGVALLGHAQWFWLVPAVFRLRAEH